MRKTLLLLALAVACNKEQPVQQSVQQQPLPVPQASQPAPGAEATVPRITPADLQQRQASVTLIDVRHADNYTFAHIPGALHIPLSFIEQEAPYLPKDKPIVTYCT
jgi:hypothetical protein